jgi:hypothetical protein
MLPQVNSVMRDEIDIPINGETRAKLNRVGRVTLNDKQIKALKCELEDYALDRESELAVRPTDALKKHRRKIEKNVRELVESFSDLGRKLSRVNEPFDEVTAMNDEILLGFAGVNGGNFLGDLLQLKTYLEEERHCRASGGRPSDIWWSHLLHSLATLYLESGGRSTAVSRDAVNDRQSVFIDFAWVAIELLPQRLRPHSKQALASAWEKQRNAKHAPPKAPRRAGAKK